jgi:hypothetical protein
MRNMPSRSVLRWVASEVTPKTDLGSAGVPLNAFRLPSPPGRAEGPHLAWVSFEPNVSRRYRCLDRKSTVGIVTH